MKRAAPLVGLMTTACLAPAYVPGPFEAVPEPDPAEVASVVFLVGDAGAARRELSPLIHRLRADVEQWSAALERDSAVSVLFLGDNIYPDGLRDPAHPDFAEDSARLHAQVWVVDGPAARAHESFGVFLPGNHDWGNMSGPEGVDRLRNQESALRAHALSGPRVEMLPVAGTPGPAVIDLPGSLRVLAVGTHWWLRSERPERRAQFLADVRAALDQADGRTVLVAAHHPFASAGPHSGSQSTRLDPLWLLRRTGAVVQDMNSGPFTSLRDGLSGAFQAAGAPLLFAAGHDHSLQLLRGDGVSAPTWVLVSGAGSKLTGVAQADALEWASAQPGYMKLLFRTDGGVELHVEGVPEALSACPPDDTAPGCLEAGVRAFSKVYSARLR